MDLSLGIAPVCLPAIGAAVILSAKTGYLFQCDGPDCSTGPALCSGLSSGDTSTIFDMADFSSSLRHLCAVTVFAVLLRAYPAWRMVWFMFIFMVEAPLFLVTLENVVHPRRHRKHG